ncbi:helix-turn-helix transcriptional regulator [uncultured Chitinophaga sp.]|uniref:helix-turn-helix domain-containing protein n=1 Tax=uncultured Chitinophaga sp. TaxID=339340 RepID=UPI0025E84255|nr:helix-turn-helix transcriptional regulator [uncultured Chitinophaga sp.]
MLTRLPSEMRLGPKIKKLRELKNFTQDYVASRLKIGVTAYGNIERDMVKEMTVDRLLEIAEVLEMDFADIINFDLENPLSSTLSETEAKLSGNNDDWYATCIMAIVEHGIRDKKLVISMMSNWSETSKKMETAVMEVNKTLHAVFGQQQQLIEFLKKYDTR